MPTDLTPWVYLVNCMAIADRPLRIHDELKAYSRIVTKKLLHRYPDLNVRNNRYEIAGLLSPPGPLLIVDYDSNLVSIDRQECDDWTLDKIVNPCLEPQLRQGVLEVIKEAYEEFNRQPQ